MATRQLHLSTILCGFLLPICAAWLFPLDSVSSAWEVSSNSTVNIKDLFKNFVQAAMGRFLVTAVMTSCLALLAYHVYIRRNPSSLPPGPTGLPVVGYLPWLDPKAPFRTLSALTKKYGSVFSVQLGNVATVVIADANILRNTLNLECTTGRAPLYLTHGIMQMQGIICAEGELWKEHRKFILSFMRGQGMRGGALRDVMEARIQGRVDELIQDLRKSGGAPVDLEGPLLHNLGNTMNQLIFGIHYSEEDPTWRWLRFLLVEGIKMVGIAGPLNFLPFLRFLPKYRKVINFIRENQRKSHEEYQKIIEKYEKSQLEDKHDYEDKDPEEEEEEEEGKDEEEDSEKEKRGGGGGGGGGVVTKPRDSPPAHIVEAFLQERLSRGEDEGSFTYKQLHHVAADLFGAGTDTALTTLRWHFLYMALHPEIQARVQAELDALSEVQVDEERFCADTADSEGVAREEGADTGAGKKGLPVGLAAQDRLPFTQACLMESQRLASVVPLGVPHGVSKDLQLSGYTIPKGTMLLPLLWHIHHDPKEWKDPHSYLPDRFLDAEGRVRTRVPAFLPFQTGRRMCIGDEFGRMVLFLFTAKILLEFNLALDPRSISKGEDPTSDPECGFTLGPRPYKLVLTPRK